MCSLTQAIQYHLTLAHESYRVIPYTVSSQVPPTNIVRSRVCSRSGNKKGSIGMGDCSTARFEQLPARVCMICISHAARVRCCVLNCEHPTITPFWFTSQQLSPIFTIVSEQRWIFRGGRLEDDRGRTCLIAGVGETSEAELRSCANVEAEQLRIHSS